MSYKHKGQEMDQYQRYWCTAWLRKPQTSHTLLLCCGNDLMHSKQQKAPSRDLLKMTGIILLSFLAILLHFPSNSCFFVCLFVCVSVFGVRGDCFDCMAHGKVAWLSSNIKMISSYNSEPSGSWDYFSRLIHYRCCGIATGIISPKPIGNATSLMCFNHTDPCVNC